MIWFQQVLPICMIANLLVRGYVLIAADVDDFKNLANTFLSRSLAEQLIGLVSESSHSSNHNTRTQTNKQQMTNEKIPEVSFSKIGEIVKDKLLKAYRVPHSIPVEKATYSPAGYNRRYRTIKNKGKRKEPIENNIMTQPDYENPKVEPRFVRDDLENLLQNMADHSHNNDKNNNYAQSNLNETGNIFSQETMEPVGLFDKIIRQAVNDHHGMSKRLDYTETKLGDWNYNAETSQPPVPIKNVKSGYTYQLNKYSDRKIPEMPNDEEQLLEEDETSTRHSWNEVNKIKTMKQRIVGLYNAVNQDLHVRPQKEEQKERQKNNHKDISFEKFDSYESLPSGSKNKGSSAKKAKKQQVVEYDSFDHDFLGSMHDNIRKEKTDTLSKEDNGMYETQMLESENLFHDKLKDDNPQTGEHILEPQAKDIHKKVNKKPENYMDDAHSSGFKNKPSSIEKGGYKTEKESYDLEPKDKDVYKKKPSKKLVEENDIYEKYALSFKSDYSRETKIDHQQTHDSHTVDLGIKNKVKDINLNKKESYNKETKNKDIHKRKPYKQMMEENDMYEKYALSYKSDDSSEIKVNHQQTPDNDKDLRIKNKNKDKNQNKKESYNIEPKEKDIHKKKPYYKQLIEEDGMHDKYSLNHKPILGSRESKTQYTDSLDKSPNIRNQFSNPEKHNHYKSISNERLFLNDQERPNEKVTFNGNSKYHQFVTEALKKQPLPEKSDESESDVKKIEPGPIKANTEYFIDSDEFTHKPEVIKAKTGNILDTVEGNKKSSKKFTMKGTEIPKRQFYTMSSPDYYHKLPRIVEKYDFGESIPENDRIRNKEKHVKREPAMINRKIRLS